MTDDQIRAEFEHALRRRDYATIDDVARSLGVQELAEGARAPSRSEAAPEVTPLPNRS